MRSSRARAVGQYVVDSTTSAIRRRDRSCWGRIFLSPVTNTPKPAASAASSSSPLVRLSQPISAVVRTSWPASARRRGLGTLWSSRMRGTPPQSPRLSLPGGVVDDRPHLLLRRVEHLGDLRRGYAAVRVFQDGVGRQPRALQQRRPAHLPRHRLHQLAPAPVDRPLRHGSPLFLVLCLHRPLRAGLPLPIGDEGGRRVQGPSRCMVAQPGLKALPTDLRLPEAGSVPPTGAATDGMIAAPASSPAGGSGGRGHGAPCALPAPPRRLSRVRLRRWRPGGPPRHDPVPVEIPL